MHYKTIQFNIKIPLNIHNFHLILRLCAVARRKIWHFSNFYHPPPPPPQSEKWIDAAGSL